MNARPDPRHMNRYLEDVDVLLFPKPVHSLEVIILPDKLPSR